MHPPGTAFLSLSRRAVGQYFDLFDVLLTRMAVSEADVDIWTATMASTSSQLDEKVADHLYRRGPDQPSSSSLARRVRVQPLLLSLLLFVR